IELATLGQAVQSQLRVPSKMAEAINAGEDLHRRIAGKVTGKAPHLVTREERQKAKAINFGKPGGMGTSGLKRYAESSYGVSLTDEEAERLTTVWLTEFPEMNQFLERDEGLGYSIAKFFHLTPADYAQWTDNNWILQRDDTIGAEHEPCGMLGWM